MDVVVYALLKKQLGEKANLVDGKIPADELPSYVDDVVEYANRDAFPETGEGGKIYVALDTGYTYRWSGSTYVQIGGQDLSDYVTKTELQTDLSTKQDTLVSGTNIKTVNSVSLVGSGNVEISGSTFVVTDVIIND